MFDGYGYGLDMDMDMEHGEWKKTK